MLPFMEDEPERASHSPYVSITRRMQDIVWGEPSQTAINLSTIGMSTLPTLVQLHVLIDK